ncbi:RcnB family protein [Acinetobacter bohemicus]|uniref:RcnB family protein n=1 Tax=Acinetobacter TaxID=469 RepID=UPI00209B2BE3|nr:MULTISPECIES: RcnB family protein [Acinetobacter]MCO8042588.1 RcnB family protein [Acinetobacter sp. S4400-12]MCU7224915.1 RcnB family protein [Acinetobacter bohemicus]
MQKVLFSAVLAGLCSAMSGLSIAGNAWTGYGSSDRYNKPYHPSSRPDYPTHPHHSHRPVPPNAHNPQRPPHWGYPPVHNQSGLNIRYQAPTTIYQNNNSYRWVNGDPNVARIESSNYTLITDWQRLGLPAPPAGTYWIYENGRYVLVPNR